MVRPPEVRSHGSVRTQFVRVSPWSNKVKCTDCGATGLPGTMGHPQRWQDPHYRGHSPCPRCGRMLTVKRDGQPRVHTRCPAPPTDLPPEEHALRALEVAAEAINELPDGALKQALLRDLGYMATDLRAALTTTTGRTQS